MNVPPMEFTIDTEVWNTNPNRQASRQISKDNQSALSTLINELLEMKVMHTFRKQRHGLKYT